MAETPSELQTEIEKLEARHAEHPEGRFFVPLANAYRKTGEIGRAESVLREGLRRHPDYLSAHIVLGRCLADRGATGEAVAEFKHVLSIDPQNLIALRTLGELAMGSGRADEAASWYEQLLAVDPMNEEARRALDSLAEPQPAPAPEPDTDWWGGAAAAAPEPLPEPDSGSAAATAAGPAGSFAMPEGEREAEAPGGEVTGEVVTETIAELYARQGLVDRAIEVYRELIRRRGGDAGLERRIADLMAPPAPPEESAAPEPPADPHSRARDDFEPGVAQRERSALAPEPAPREEALPADDALRPYDEPLPVLGEVGALPDPADDLPRVDSDPFASSFEYGFLDEDAGRPEPRGSDAGDWLGTEASPADREPRHAPDAGRTIAEYLGALAAWQPGAGSAADAADRGGFVAESTDAAPPEPLGPPSHEPPEEPALDPFATSAARHDAVAAEPEVDGAAEHESGIAEPGAAIADPWVSTMVDPDAAGPPAEPVETWAGAPSETDVAPGLPAPAASPDEGLAFPWETPAETDAAPPAAAPSAANAGEDEPFPFESFFSEAAIAEESAARAASEPAAADPAPGPASPGGEEEDDLESFQAWLRSLKR